ncbi:MAG TPA: cytochrome c3 family protein [Longimicrobiales bacterium]
MGRRLLLTGLAALALALGGCAGQSDEHPAAVASGAAGADTASDQGAPMSDGAHAGLACARCHDGAAIARDIPAASDDACMDCHESGAARTVSLGAIPLEHENHAGDSATAAGCASCHTHARGDLELDVTTTGCALCHAASLDGSGADDCRLCHTDPAHVALTSQSVPLMHSDLPWIGGECVRCHYDVGRPETRVHGAVCVACHAAAEDVMERGAGRDLHPSHTGVACSSCHEDVSHRIVSMSTGVRLSCTQCHATVHDVPAGMDFEPATCNACHTDVHAAEQRLMLGAAPAGLAAAPSDKFLLGLTCRSCHVQTADGAATRTSCVSCHSPEYATVLGWWERGTAERTAQIAEYIATAFAFARSASGDSARAHAAAADSLLRFVRDGDAAHNLPLSHRALNEALTHAAAAWTAAGRTAPARPDIGRMPRMGQCTYCHYTWREPLFQQDMPDAFHRRVMRRGEGAAARIGTQ